MTQVNKVFFKKDGAWVPVKRPFVRKSNVWMPAKTLYIKSTGTWAPTFVHDTTPCSPPLVSLENKGNKYIKVGVRLPGAADDELKLVRVLVSKVDYPKAWNGSGYLPQPDVDYPTETWADWYYNGTNTAGGRSHGDGTTYTYKQYPPNPSATTDLPGNMWYYFTAWSQDKNGNWSVGTFTKLWMPKNGITPSTSIKKEVSFQATDAGSAGLNGANYTTGTLIARDSPRSNGFWFYGNKITNAVGEQGTPTVKSARIRITRGTVTGNATANVNLFWHNHMTGAFVDDAGSSRNDITKVGTLNKGESKWFDIPTSYYPYFNTQIKGFGLAAQSGANDLITAVGLAADLRCGEVNVVWEEAR